MPYVNKSFNTKITLKQLKANNSPIDYVPLHIVKQRVRCSGCYASYTPNWTEKVGPIQIETVGNPDPDPSKCYVAVPQSVGTVCPNCSNQNFVPIPQRGVHSYYHCFGDEAYRDFGKDYFFCYAFFCVHESNSDHTAYLVDEAKKMLNRLTGGVFGSRSIHMKDLYEETKKKDGMISRAGLKEFFEEITSLMLSDYRKYTIFTCCSAFEKDHQRWKSQHKLIKQHILFNVMTNTIDSTTDRNYSPIFFLEDDGKMGWVAELFARMRMSLYFPLIHKNVPLMNPKMISKKAASKSESEGLQIADLVCFSVARTVHNVMNNQRIEFDPARFGNVNYIYHDAGSKAYVKVFQTGLDGLLC